LRRTALALLALTAAAAGQAVLVHAESTSAVRPTPWATLAFSRSAVVGGGVLLLGEGRVTTAIPGGVEPAWSPDGRRLAYIAPGAGGAGDLFVADADGTHRGRLTATLDIEESSPDWSADGTRLVLERNGRIEVIRADGSNEGVLAKGDEPAWSPGGRRIAFALDGDLWTVSATGGTPIRVGLPSPGGQTEPAWSPDARRLAYVSDQTGDADVRVVDVRTGLSVALTADEAIDSSPAFSADGRRVVFVSDRGGVEALWSVSATGGVAVPLAAPSDAAQPVSRPARQTAELLPDFDQQAPTDLQVRKNGRRHLLWFTSAADNVGLGPFIVNGRRDGSNAMRAAQRVRLGDGSLRTYPGVGVWHYNNSSDHSHWHLRSFQRYELRRADGKIVVRDRKSGFCIGDRYGVAPGQVENRVPRPVFRGFCNRHDPGSSDVAAGTSVGFSDRYHSRLDGQNVDLTGVPAGRYLLVNRANPSLSIRELRYENNAASVAIRVTWPQGTRRAPAIKLLATCPSSDRC
jgi:dipeptidyl aminopeptidase/acylaminoacyl peptidase